jgi:glycosyltransferase involved in cell wall biosynthesis
MNKSINPLVSIIIPTFNRANIINYAIDSVLAQSYSNFELIIVDNNSNDDTLEKISAYKDKRIKVYVNHTGKAASTRNYGINHASGEIIALLDSDDTWVYNKLNLSVKAILEGADFVYHSLYLKKEDSFFFNFFKFKIKSRILAFPVHEDLFFNGNTICTSSVVFRKHLFSSSCQFRELPGLLGSEDYDLWLNISKITNKFVKLPNTLGYYTIGSDNLTTPLRNIDNIICILDLHNKKYNFIPEWSIYSFTTSYFKSKQYTLSLFFLKKLLKNNYFYFFNYKIIYILFMLCIRYMNLSRLNNYNENN